MSAKLVQASSNNCIRLQVQSQPGYAGPEAYWPKKSERNVRTFSSEQLAAGQCVISLQYGTNKGATQAGMSMGKSRHIID